MNSRNSYIKEEPRQIPVAADVDLYVVGGGCSGTFAAIRAARMGLKVALVEVLNQFGGAGSSRMVNVWHSFWSTDGAVKLMAGLNEECMERLKKRGAVIEREKTNADWQFYFNPAELAIELDQMVTEAGVIPFLHARAVGVSMEVSQIQAVILEDKSGRRAIRARQYIDASGDADLCWLAGGEDSTAKRPHLQPPTMAGLFEGLRAMRKKDPTFKTGAVVFDEANPHHLPSGFLWAAPLPGSSELQAVFGTRVTEVDCSVAEDLTRAEMTGRKQLRQILDALRHAKGDEQEFTLAALPACIGIRDSRHARCSYQLQEMDVLDGRHFEDAIAFGSYRVDVHHQGEPGITFKYLDGRSSIRHTDGRPPEDGRWREEREVDPTYYEIPFSCLKVRGVPNLLVSGRCIDADVPSFGAIRVMVNCNQMGEAAAVAAVLGCEEDIDLQEVDPQALRDRLRQEGACIPEPADQLEGSGTNA